MPYSESRETYNLTRKKLFQKNILASHNADHMPPKMLVSGILILTYFGTVDLGNPILCNGSDVSNLYATHPVPKYVKMRIQETSILGGM